MPDILFKTKEEIPEGLREHAEERNGAFAVDVAPGKKLKEFRDNNIAIARERDELKTKVTTYASKIGEDVEAVASELVALRTIKQQVDDQKLVGTDKIEATVLQRVQAIEKGYKDQLTEANQKLTNTLAKTQTFESRFKRSVLHQGITSVVLDGESGANPQALGDILACAETDFAVSDDGRFSPVKDGKTVYGADGVTPMTPKEWLSGLLKSKPYFQKPSAGGGATGGRASGNDFGMSDEAFQKLSPAARLSLAREQQSRR